VPPSPLRSSPAQANRPWSLRPDALANHPGRAVRPAALAVKMALFSRGIGAVSRFRVFRRNWLF
jgi:hypothetical protein